MPVSLHAAGQVGASPGMDVADGHLSKHVAAGRDTDLWWLGDVIPIRPLASVISVGDVVIVAGIVLVVAAGMVRPRGQELPASTVAPQPDRKAERGKRWRDERTRWECRAVREAARQLGGGQR